MKINIKATNLKLTPNIQKYIEEKISELEKLIRKSSSPRLAGGGILGETWVEVEKTTRHHLKGDVFRAEVQIKLAKRSVRAESVKDNLYFAITDVKDELQRELKKYQGKKISQFKKRARRFKDVLHLSSFFRRFKK